MPRRKSCASVFKPMEQPFANYLRTYRKKSGLSQDQVAEVLGLYSGQTFSRYECLARIPSLETALGCQVLFGVLPHRLFPGLYTDITQLTRTRMRALLNAIPEDDDAMERRSFLRDALRRADMRHNSYDTEHHLGAESTLPLFQQPGVRLRPVRGRKQSGRLGHQDD